ncbi:MAG: hypothetical protein U0168_07915 [Nannocystaceae bacterium]
MLRHRNEAKERHESFSLRRSLGLAFATMALVRRAMMSRPPMVVVGILRPGTVVPPSVRLVWWLPGEFAGA